MNILTFQGKIWLVMSICYLMSFAVKAQKTTFEWPDTPASTVFQDFIQSYNTGEEDQIRMFVKTHYQASNLEKENDRVEYWMDMYHRFGPVKPYELSINKPYDLEVWLQGTITKSWFAPEFIINKKDNKIEGQAMLQGALPDGIKIGLNDEKSMLREFKKYLSENEEKGFYQGAVLIQKGEEVLLESGYGYQNVEKQLKNTIDTRFRISSIMKTITSVACLKLAQEGLLDLNVPVSKYLPELPEHIATKFSVADILGHTSGYELDGIEGFREAYAKTTSMEEVYKLQLEYLHKWEHYENFNPDYKYDYANDSYDLAAIIIEKISKMPFEDFLKRFLFDVSGMTSTSFEADVNTGCYRYDLAGGGVIDFSSHYPNGVGKISGAGSIVSTVKDLQLFFNTLLKTSKILDISHKGWLFSPRAKISIASNVIRDKNFVSLIDVEKARVKNYYGLGTFINYDSVFHIGHSGTNIGNSTEWRYFPEADILFISLSNNRNGGKNSYNYFKNLMPRN